MQLLKERLQAGETLYGTWLRIAHPVVMEVLGHSGFDFIQIDMEHGAIGTQDLGSLLLAANASGVPALVRVPGLDTTIISRTLDMGAAGVVVPQINTPQAAEQAVLAARFYPAGTRGLGGACRADGYGQVSFAEFAASANQQTLLVLQIESKQAVDSIDQILDQAGDSVDIFYIGPADLSQSLGIPGQFDHPLLQDTIKQLVTKLRSHGKTVGIHSAGIDNAHYFATLGVQFITCSFDVGLLSAGAAALVKKIKKNY